MCGAMCQSQCVCVISILKFYRATDRILGGGGLHSDTSPLHTSESVCVFILTATYMSLHAACTDGMHIMYSFKKIGKFSFSVYFQWNKYAK